ncbi:MAG: helix-turn-helix domain-containing protein [Sphingomonadaceae bacterium]
MHGGSVIENSGIRLHLFSPTPALRPYITVYYRTEAIAHEPVEDLLPPEWANIRVGHGEVYEAANGDAPMGRVPTAVISGPSTKGARLRIAEGDFWGVGLLPLGFAQFLDMSASDVADRFVDASDQPAAEYLRFVLDRLAAAPGDMAGNVALLDKVFEQRVAKPLRQGAQIVALHEAILSDDVQSVAALVDRVGVSTRTVERLCRRYFGFTPQMLLRRQRFLRSLARYMVDPTMRWIDSLDSHYHDQAQFVREFRYFMGMRPREYAAMAHPIAQTALDARRIALGEPMQVLHPAINLPSGQASVTSGV